MNLKVHFTNIYMANKWHGEESKSGTGSDLKNTKIMRPQLIELINNLNISSMIDAPCGDFNWMKEALKEININYYLGVDIVSRAILNNINKYHIPKKVEFADLDLIKEVLPTVDLIFCRDCLVHLSATSIKSVLNNFKKSGATYLITTTFVDRTRNNDIIDGGWRYLNLTLPPYDFPEPIKLINEGCTEAKGRFPDKSLGLWKLEDISWY